MSACPTYPGKTELVDKLKALQRSNHMAGKAWRKHCFRNHRGLQDPSGHEKGALEAFLALYASEARPSGSGEGEAGDGLQPEEEQRDPPRPRSRSGYRSSASASRIRNKRSVSRHAPSPIPSPQGRVAMIRASGGGEPHSTPTNRRAPATATHGTGAGEDWHALFFGANGPDRYVVCHLHGRGAEARMVVARRKAG